MSSWVSWLTGARNSPQDGTKNTIVRIRQQSTMLEKKIAILDKKIDEQNKEIEKFLAADKRDEAKNALMQRKAIEKSKGRYKDTLLKLEETRNTVEDATLNNETFKVMADATKVLGKINKMRVSDVDETMDKMQDEMATAQEISTAISQRFDTSRVDDEELDEELKEMEQEIATKKITETEPVPRKTVASDSKIDDIDNELESMEREMRLGKVPQTLPKSRAPPVPTETEDDDDERELAELKAALAA